MPSGDVDDAVPATGPARIKAEKQGAAKIISAAKAEAATIIEQAKDDRRRLDAIWQAIRDLLPNDLFKRVQDRFKQIIDPKP